MYMDNEWLKLLSELNVDWKRIKPVIEKLSEAIDLCLRTDINKDEIKDK